MRSKTFIWKYCENIRNMKKIMFNETYNLTQAVLSGTKTMTRRVERFELSARMLDEGFKIEGGLNDKGRWIFTLYNKNGDTIDDIIPRYNIGEVVAIAQSYHNLNKSGYTAPEWLDHVCESSAGYENKMFVRADLMPHHIRITDIKIERLQDISKEDCLKEGITFIESLSIIGYDAYFFTVKPKARQIYGNILKFFSSPQRAYADLIDKISGRGTWKRNPWVVVYTFERVD